MPYWKKPNGYDVKWRNKRKIKAVAFLGGKCVHCGDTKELEFDHIKPETKEFDISCGWHKSLKVIWAELKKCQLLCRKCHLIKTLENIGPSKKKWKEIQHGKIWAYTGYKCRCELCCTAKREQRERLK